MLPGDLTTLPALKAWLGIPPTTTTEDVLLQQLISAASMKVQMILGRAPLAVSTYSEIHDAIGGKNWIVLNEWPVLNVASVELRDNVITVSSSWPPTTGFLLENMYNRPQRLTIYGYYLWPEKNSVRVTYTAGYKASDPPQPVPTGRTLTPLLTWIGDVGPTYADGAPLVLGADPANLAPGEYAVTPPTSTANATYTFSAPDEGASVVLVYSSPPSPIERCVIDKAGLEYKRKDRIGIASQVLSGQGSVTYADGSGGAAAAHDAMHAQMLLPYRRVAPI